MDYTVVIHENCNCKYIRNKFFPLLKFFPHANSFFLPIKISIISIIQSIFIDNYLYNSIEMIKNKFIISGGDKVIKTRMQRYE